MSSENVTGISALALDRAEKRLWMLEVCAVEDVEEEPSIACKARASAVCQPAVKPALDLEEEVLGLFVHPSAGGVHGREVNVRSSASLFVSGGWMDGITAEQVLAAHKAYEEEIQGFDRSSCFRRPEEVDRLVAVCRRQIELAPQAAAAFRQLSPAHRPGVHLGYSNLLIVLRMRQDWAEYIRLCERAKAEGWAGAWDRFIDQARRRAAGEDLRPDPRTHSLYSGRGLASPDHARNPHILQWWAQAQDDVLRERIATMQWAWGTRVFLAVAAATPEATLEAWKESDPLCARFSWQRVLHQFALARAEVIGLTSLVREPRSRSCPVCGQQFVEDSLVPSCLERVGADRLEFCQPCMTRTYPGGGEDDATRPEILSYLQHLAQLIGKIPTQRNGVIDELRCVDQPARKELVRLAQRKPSAAAVKAVFGSWLQALIEAGLLEDGIRRTARGVQTVAQDGHVCLSLAEKTIDDWLSAHGIAHEKECAYPEGRYRADWRLGDVFIEYFGLTGDAAYDARTKEKKRLCRAHGITLVGLLPEDLARGDRLERKLAAFLPGKAT